MPKLRESEEGTQAQRCAEPMAHSTGDAQRIGAENTPVPGLSAQVPIYSAYPDDVDDGSSGVWDGMGADDILRDDARRIARAHGASADAVQRELGIISRTEASNIARNEAQLEDSTRADGTLKHGRPPTTAYANKKEERKWQSTSTTGPRCHGASSLTETRIRSVPHFGLAPVARVEGTAASQRSLPERWTLNIIEPARTLRKTPGRSRNMSNAPSTFDMERSIEMDIFDEMRAEGSDTPTSPVTPPMLVRFDRWADVETAYDDFAAAYVGDDLDAIAHCSVRLIRTLVAFDIAYGLPLSDLWDTAHDDALEGTL